MDKSIIIGNWKMNLKINSSQKLIKDIQRNLSKKDFNCCEIIVCPSNIHLESVYNKMKTKISLGCQNLFWENDGAYTGEISAAMMKNINCKYAIIGHSERRNYIKETDEMINKKIRACQNNSITPILCIGESAKQRKDLNTRSFLKKQILSAYRGINFNNFRSIIIAYEPIWAIGSSNPANPEDANEIALYIKKLLINNYKNIDKKTINILYGGSVNAKNIKSFTDMNEIDGSLVGGESIKPAGFVGIIKNSYK